MFEMSYIYIFFSFFLPSPLYFFLLRPPQRCRGRSGGPQAREPAAASLGWSEQEEIKRRRKKKKEEDIYIRHFKHRGIIPHVQPW
jgi:hypothetical protein